MAATVMSLVMPDGSIPKVDDRIADAGNGTANATETTGNACRRAADIVRDAVSAKPTGREFVNKAATSGAFDFASAGKDVGFGGIGSFAPMTIKDHIASTAKMKALAAEVRPALRPDRTLSDDQNGELGEPKSLRAAECDSNYVDQQTDRDRSALSFMRIHSIESDVPPLKTKEGEMMPRAEVHIDNIETSMIGSVLPAE